MDLDLFRSVSSARATVRSLFHGFPGKSSSSILVHIPRYLSDTLLTWWNVGTAMWSPPYLRRRRATAAAAAAAEVAAAAAAAAAKHLRSHVIFSLGVRPGPMSSLLLFLPTALYPLLQPHAVIFAQ